MTEKIYYMARWKAIMLGIFPAIFCTAGFFFFSIYPILQWVINFDINNIIDFDIGDVIVYLIMFIIMGVLSSSGLYLLFFCIPLVKLTSHGIYYSNNISTTFRHGVTLPMIMPYGGKVDNCYISFNDIYSFHPKSYVITTKDVTTRNSLSTKDEKYNKKEIFIDFKHLSWKDQKEITQCIINKIS